MDTPEIPLALKRFVVERDSAAIQTIQQELFASPIPIKGVSFIFPPPAGGAQRYTGIFGVEPVFEAEENTVGIDPSVLDLPAAAGQRAHHRHADHSSPSSVLRAHRSFLEKICRKNWNT